MKNIINVILILLVLPMASCELFQQQEDTLNPQERLINHPNIQILGEAFQVFDVRTGPYPPYEDDGARAFFGPIVTDNPDERTSDMITSGTEFVDPNTPGFYDVTYQVTTTNSLNQEVTAVAVRTVAVTNPDDDLSGTWTLVTKNAGWNGTGENTNGTPPPQAIARLGTARFFIGPYFNGGLAGNEMGAGTELRIADDVILVPTHVAFGIQWQGFGEVASRDPVTDQVTEFWFDWNSIGFQGGIVFARNTYTRN